MKGNMKKILTPILLFASAAVFAGEIDDSTAITESIDKPETFFKQFGNYVIGGDNITVVQNRSASRHVSASFDLGSTTGTKFLTGTSATGNTLNGQAGFGWLAGKESASSTTVYTPTFTGTGADIYFGTKEGMDVYTWVRNMTFKGVNATLDYQDKMSVNTNAAIRLEANAGINSTLNLSSMNQSDDLVFVIGDSKQTVNLKKYDTWNNFVFNSAITTDISALGDTVAFNYTKAVNSANGGTFNSSITGAVGKTINVNADVDVEATNFQVAGERGQVSTINLNLSSSRFNLATNLSANINIADGKSIKALGRWTANNAVVNVGKNAVLNLAAATAGSGVSGNNIFSMVNAQKGSSITVEAGLRTGGVFEGSLIINGSGRDANVLNADTFIYGIYGNTTFASTATLAQNKINTTYAKNWVRGTATVTSNAATGALVFGNDLYITKGAKFVLNSTDAFAIAGAESQAKSVFRFENAGGIEVGANDTTFVINAQNNIGGFLFNDAASSKLNLEFGADGSLVLGRDESVKSLDGAYLTDGSIVLSSAISNKLRVYDLTADEINKYFSVNGENLELSLVDAGDGSYFVNVISNVPEPATYAMVFASIALAFAAYRRRK